MKIRKKVNALIKKYETNNPFRLCRDLNIIVLHEPLGEYKGYYNKVYRQRFIHINESLNSREKLITCAHELGHAILHTNESTPHMRSHTFYHVGRYEKQADEFAAHLLITENDIESYKEVDIFRMAGELDLPVELVQIKLGIF